MSFTVFGYIDGVAYHVHVGDGGAIDATANAERLLGVHEGTMHKVTPTGPVMRLDRSDPASVLCALAALTQITSVDGDPPQLYEPEEPGVVY